MRNYNTDLWKPFYNDLTGDDELGMVVRAHLHIEHELNELLKKVIPKYEYLKPMGLDYSQKVHLSIALVLKAQFKAPLLNFSKIRNDFAHNLNSKLSVDKVRNLYESFAAEDKEIIQEQFKTIRDSRPPGDQEQSFKELSPRDKFILISVALHSMLIVAQDTISLISQQLPK